MRTTIRVSTLYVVVLAMTASFAGLPVVASTPLSGKEMQVLSGGCKPQCHSFSYNCGKWPCSPEHSDCLGCDGGYYHNVCLPLGVQGDTCDIEEEEMMCGLQYEGKCEKDAQNHQRCDNSGPETGEWCDRWVPTAGSDACL